MAGRVQVMAKHRYSGRKLREIGNEFGVSESAVAQASRRILVKKKNDKKLEKIILRVVKELSLSNV